MQNLSNFDLESIYSDDPTDAIKKILDSYSQFENDQFITKSRLRVL